MGIRLATLLDRVPPETETIVERTKRRFNQHVRQILRDETRLRLSKSIDATNDDERETHVVRVFVTPGMPVELEKIELNEDLWLAIELAPLKSQLSAILVATEEISPTLRRLAARPQFNSRFPYAFEATTQMNELARNLLNESAKFDLLERVFGIDEDVLGLYSYRIPAEGATPRDIRVDLYWAIIGFVAKVLGVTVEALTVKVLAHELAHAFTHIGMDADGHFWSGNTFAKSERGLKEGLAQYYTVRVLDRMQHQMPSSREAYDKLLPHQPCVYHTHIPWLSDFKAEEVRHAMLTTRRGGAGKVAGFELALKDARSQLRADKGL